MVKTLTILGSTGSIGRNVLEVVSNFPEKFKIVGLTSNRNVDVLIEQI
ncbi:1-deoxy-D-xylulose-5-phosphate reductoisomerase, partial [Candidatus Calescamantes bacterium]|nr:1-deoxy-D-xylulose-5-phosphate reductoisomerase [Candidatus Calescamantes bacterium]